MDNARRTLRGTTAMLLAWCTVGCQSSSGPSSDTRVVDNAALVAYLQSLTDEVAGDSSYRVSVYNADFAQAFALPGGEIALTVGMLAFIQNQAELACVLGHEIAHHQLGHVADLYGTDPSPSVDGRRLAARARTSGG
jgi:predicted Zn-dependent protease